MSTTKTAPTWTDAANALAIPGTDDRKRVDAAQRRFRALGYTRPCGRCGGGGEYSFCRDYGTKCFGCSGSGLAFKPLTTTMIAEAAARQAAGELDAYFARNKAAAEAKRAIAPLKAAADAEWSKGAAHTSYKALRDMKIDSAQVVRSAEFRAVDLINDVWGVACDLASDIRAKKMTAEERVEGMRECLAAIREINAAWSAYDGADRLTAREASVAA